MNGPRRRETHVTDNSQGIKKHQRDQNVLRVIKEEGFFNRHHDDAHRIRNRYKKEEE